MKSLLLSKFAELISLQTIPNPAIKASLITKGSASPSDIKRILA